MFKNIGTRLMNLAYFLCTVGIVLSVIYGFILITDKKVLIGVLIIIVGSLSSWISSCIVYAIGEIAVNTETSHGTYAKEATERAYAKQEEERKKKIEAVFKAGPKNSSPTQRNCPHCGEIVKSRICDMCGKENDFFK